MNFKILDIFSGAGGFSLGFEKYKKFKTVIACDFNKAALNTLEKNFPETKVICGDLTESIIKKKIIKESKKLGVNMIIGGPPCQGFSLQGKKLGLKDPRNFLFLEFVELVKEINPEIFVLENVKNMINAEKGYFINEIVKEFENLGYNVNYNILNSKNFGVPQTRERSFVVGSKEKNIILKNEKIKPFTDVYDAISDLLYLNSGEGQNNTNYQMKAKSNYQKLLRKNSEKLYNHIATKHSELTLKKLTLIPAECGKEYLPLKYHGNQKFSSTWSRLKWHDFSPTIDTRFDTPSNGKNSHPVLNRAITAREAARIQSFPDDFVFYGCKTDICKQIGNAVPPFVASYIGMEILKYYDINKKYYSDSFIINGDCMKVSEEINSFDHIITDPPYNISKKNNFHTMKNKKYGLDFGEWDKSFDPIDWIKYYVPKLKKGGTLLIFCSYLFISDIIRELEKYNCETKDIIRWIKTNPMPRNMDRRYVSDHEFAIWAIKKGDKWIFNKNKPGYLIPEIKTSIVSGKERLGHPTQKSLKLMKELIKIHTNEEDIILDPFMGTGTTCLAAKELNRKFIGIEREYNYYVLAQERLKK